LNGDFFIPLDPDVELVFLKIRDGKDTTDNEDGGSRITWVLFDLFEEIEAQYFTKPLIRTSAC